MKIEYINPFIESVYDLFTTMLSASISRGDVGVTKDLSDPTAITALIGMSGPARGMVSLSFPGATALKMVNRLLGTTSKVMDDSVSDAVAEIVNIVAGGAKAKFPLEDGAPPIDLSIPTVVRGRNYNVDYPSDAVWLEVPFTSDLGPFCLRVTFVFDKEQDT